MPDPIFERYKEALKAGHVAALRGKSDQALAHYRTASTIAPDRPLPHVSMAEVLLLLGRVDEALVACETALELAPRDETVLETAARVFARTGRRSDAAGCLDRLTHVLVEAGRVEDAQAAAVRARDTAPSHARKARADELERAGRSARLHPARTEIAAPVGPAPPTPATAPGPSVAPTPAAAPEPARGGDGAPPGGESTLAAAGARSIEQAPAVPPAAGVDPERDRAGAERSSGVSEIAARIAGDIAGRGRRRADASAGAAGAEQATAAPPAEPALPAGEEPAEAEPPAAAAPRAEPALPAGEAVGGQDAESIEPAATQGEAAGVGLAADEPPRAMAAPAGGVAEPLEADTDSGDSLDLADARSGAEDARPGAHAGPEPPAPAHTEPEPEAGPGPVPPAPDPEALFVEAEELAAAGEPGRAAFIYAAAADAYLAAGAADTAVDACLRALAGAPGDTAVHLALARIHVASGRVERAERKLVLLDRLRELEGDTEGRELVAAFRERNLGA